MVSFFGPLLSGGLRTKVLKGMYEGGGGGLLNGEDWITLLGVSKDGEEEKKEKSWGGP